MDRIAAVAKGPQAEGPARLLGVYAFGVSALAVAIGLSVGSSLLFDKLFELQEQDLAKQLAVIVIGVLIVGALLAVLLFGTFLRRGLSALERKKRLRVPAPVWGVWLVFVTLPLFLGVYPFIRKHGAMLGLLRDGVIALLVLSAGVQLTLLHQALSRRIARATTLGVAVIAVGLLIVVGGLARSRPLILATAELSNVASLGARTGRFVTDVDRDGASSLFGGLDCAPFDGKRAPSMAEIPGNGIDEDCNGSDSIASFAMGNAARFSDALGRKQIKKYNVVWVIVETVRADHVSAIDYGKPTTPFLSKFAKESLLFTEAHSHSSATVISIPSMLSGIDPGMASWTRKRNHPQLLESNRLFAERLQDKGYKTGFVLDVYLKNNFLSIQRGFDMLMLAEPDNKNKNNRPRRNLFSTAKAAEFLARTKPGEPFFLLVYYPDPHSPYTRHKDVDSSKFDSGELGDYDTELRFTDEQLRSLVEMLKSRPAIWDNTIFVVTADHGEEFGEHGGTRHAITCHDEVIHVPLLMRIPGIAAKRIDARVGLVDIVPTLLELMGFREDTDMLSGQSLLLPALRPDKVDPTRPLFCTIASITDKYGTFFRRGVRTGKFTLLQDMIEGRYSLFDSEVDRGEQRDLAGTGQHTATMDALKAMLEASRTGNLRDHTEMTRLLKQAKEEGGTEVSE